jgi:hypothetical protein
MKYGIAASKHRKTWYPRNCHGLFYTWSHTLQRLEVRAKRTGRFADANLKKVKALRLARRFSSINQISNTVYATDNRKALQAFFLAVQNGEPVFQPQKTGPKVGSGVWSAKVVNLFLRLPNLTNNEAATILGCSIGTVERVKKDWKIPSREISAVDLPRLEAALARSYRALVTIPEVITATTEVQVKCLLCGDVASVKVGTVVFAEHSYCKHCWRKAKQLSSQELA